MTKQPSYRFAGYTESWEEKKLGEVSTITMGQSPNSENYTVNPNDYILVQGNADMKNGRVFPRVWTTQITKQARQGDLILSVRAPVGDIGKTDYDVVLGRGVASIDGNEFLYQALSQMKQNGYWSKLSTGSTFESINSNDIKSAIISLPSLPEQTAIGSFFQDIDQLISLQQRKLEVLNEQKKTYLKLLFPAKGQTKPALRFAGFEDEWKEVKLGEVTDIKTGGRDVQDSVEDGLYPFYIRSEEVKRINSYSFDGEAILVPGEGRLGEIFHYANGKFDVHQRVYKISNFTDVNAKFVLQQMKKDFKQHAMRNTVKATVDSLRLPTIQSFTVFVPTLPEQEAIGSFFQDIDKAIAKQEEKVNQLKESKQTLLRKMFI